MIGNEKCTMTCFGVPYTSRETSRQTNHKVLYGVSFLQGVFGVVEVAVCAGVLGDRRLVMMFPFVEGTVQAVLCVSVMVVCLSFVGSFGTYKRSKSVIVWWFAISIALCVSEIVASARMKEEIGEGNFDRYKGTLFLKNWKDAVGRAGREGEDREWVVEVQVRGGVVGEERKKKSQKIYI